MRQTQLAPILAGTVVTPNGCDGNNYGALHLLRPYADA